MLGILFVVLPPNVASPCRPFTEYILMADQWDLYNELGVDSIKTNAVPYT